MSLKDMFDTVTYAGADDLPKDRHGLPVVIDDDDEDNSRLAAWDEDIVAEAGFKGDQARDEQGKWDPDGGHWTWGGGNDAQPRGWSKRYPGLKDPEPFHEGDQTKLDPSWVENVIPEDS